MIMESGVEDDIICMDDDEQSSPHDEVLENEFNGCHDDEDEGRYEDECASDDYKGRGRIYLDIDAFSEFCKGPPAEQQRFSKPENVRGISWRILAQSRDVTCSNSQFPIKYLAMFLECNPDVDSHITSWSCFATAKLMILHQDEGNPQNHHASQQFERRISHVFTSRQNDWGYSNLISFEDLRDSRNGYLKDNVVKLKVEFSADVPHGIPWDSKTRTGFVGLKNQGATCYMNSALQAMFFTNKLRKAVYDIPVTGANDDVIILSLQSLFYELQHSDEAVSTTRLTRSFGWDRMESFTQHDVQELNRILIEKMERKMMNTTVENTIPSLLKGKMKSFVRCTEVDFESCREEEFYDIQLNVKGRRDILDSLREYCKVEQLDGDNKYFAEGHGLQPAEKGVKFCSFPPVLHLHLMRFSYDPDQDTNVKINDRYEFPLILDLNEFIDNCTSSEDYKYHLQAVFVHSGDLHSGHYVIFIDTNLGGSPDPNGVVPSKWCKFNDDIVSPTSVYEATVANFGGTEESRSNANAYMLVYVRESMIGDVLQPITDDDVPDSIRVHFEEERTEEEEQEQLEHCLELYTSIYIVSEQMLPSCKSFDVLPSDVSAKFPKEQIERSISSKELYSWINDRFHIVNISIENQNVALSCRFRLWLLRQRNRKIDERIRLPLPGFRFSELIVYGDDRPFNSNWESKNVIFIEICNDETSSLPTEDVILVFIKKYDHNAKQMIVQSFTMIDVCKTIDDYKVEFCRLLNVSPDTVLRCYEEVSPDSLNLLENTLPLISILTDKCNGTILIFEDVLFPSPENNAKLHFTHLYRYASVEFHMNLDSLSPDCEDADIEDDVLGVVSLDWSCSELANYIAALIGYALPQRLLPWQMLNAERPFRMLTYDEYSKKGVCEVLGINLITHDPRSPHPYILHYSKICVDVQELQGRKPMRVQIMDSDMNIKNCVIFPSMYTGSVSDILRDLKQSFHFGPHSSCELRMVRVGTSAQNLRTFEVLPISASMVDLAVKKLCSSSTVRIEEVPIDQVEPLSTSEMLLSVAHFKRDPFRMFGTPFFLKVTHRESYKNVKARIKEYLGVSDVEFARVDFAIVRNSTQVRYLDEDERVNLHDLCQSQFGVVSSNSPFLGLDHTDSCPHINRVEKHIVIKD